MRPKLSKGIFSKLFFIEQSKYTSSNYKFFYFRSSPRGNSKFGIMDIPWQRLRNQQQGTDEEIQFDSIWLARTLYDIEIVNSIEDELKKIYGDSCLALGNNRAGHTEWFSDVDIEDFETHLTEMCRDNGVELIKMNSIIPYTATKRSQCPIESPVQYSRDWCEDIWLKEIDYQASSNTL